jgi:dTDP-glucose 4,6-dehydratase
MTTIYLTLGKGKMAEFEGNNMIVLVTGGAGFIGSNFIRYLLQEEKYVQVTNYDALTYAGNLENLRDVKNDGRYKGCIVGDIANETAVEDVMAHCKPLVVVNFAAETHVDRSIKDASDFIKTNVLGVRVLMDACRRHKVARFVQISTDEVYGSLDENAPASKEDDMLLPNSPYSASKTSADLLIRSYYRTYGFPAIITRCSNNYGPYMHPEKFIPLFITNALQDKSCPLYGTGKNIRDWIHVKDHCAGILKAMKKGKPGQVYNFGGGCQKENVEVAERIMEILGKSKDLITPVKDRLGHDFRYDMDYNKAQGALGWRPEVDFDKGLEETVQWYVEHREWWEKLKK